jgi:hypothetical protein
MYLSGVHMVLQVTIGSGTGSNQFKLVRTGSNWFEPVPEPMVTWEASFVHELYINQFDAMKASNGYQTSF